MRLNEDQMKRQIEYSITVATLETLHKIGILNDEEFKESVRMMTEKYRPVLRFNS